MFNGNLAEVYFWLKKKKEKKKKAEDRHAV